MPVYDPNKNQQANSAAIASLTDNSTGVAPDGTIGAVDSVAHAADAVAELAAKVNAILVALRSAGIIST